MGRYEREYWLSDAWGTPSGTYRPYAPDLLSSRSIALSERAIAAVSRADSAVTKLNVGGARLSAMEPLARLLLRSEAIASSRIEGLEAPAAKLFEVEALDRMGVSHRNDSPEAAVLANIEVMRNGVDSLVAHGITREGICNLNAGLLRGSSLEQHGGRVRTVQNWIGGTSSSPLGAAYVPPRPQYVPAYLDDLVRFCNQTELPPVAAAAIAHAQFETVHPFVDGNGRTGRALVHAMLKRSGVAPIVLPPVSMVLATNRDRYVGALASYRFDGDGVADVSARQSEAVSEWVEFFADALSESCEHALGFERVLEAILEAWRTVVRPRAGSAADILLTLLPGSPVISIPMAAELTGRSYPAARGAVLSLEQAGVLTLSGRNKKSGLYVAGDVVNAFTAYERALSVPSGDTKGERPARAVPQRVPGRPGVLSYEELRRRLGGE